MCTVYQLLQLESQRFQTFSAVSTSCAADLDIYLLCPLTYREAAQLEAWVEQALVFGAQRSRLLQKRQRACEDE